MESDVNQMVEPKGEGVRLPSRTGRLIGMLTLLLAMVVGCELVDPNPGPSRVELSGSAPTPVEDFTPATVERGDSLYTALCERCHGPEGTGTDIWEPEIQGKTGVSYLVRYGVRSMPAFPTLSDSALESLQLYLLSFGIDNSSHGGEDLYNFYCATCHGEEGAGSTVYPGSIQSFSPIYTSVHDGYGEMPAMRISDTMIARIQEYLSGFPVDFRSLGGVEYFGRVCASCHGADGEGTRRGPEIRNAVDDYAKYVIRHGRTSPDYIHDMPRYTADSLSDSQLEGILDWLAAKPHPTDGLGLYNRFCANCHGKDARGGPVDKGLLDQTSGFHGPVRSGKGGNSYGSRDDYMPSWTSSELSDEEIDRMSAYVRRLR